MDATASGARPSVVIAGGGLVGNACAFFLARVGCDVTIVERVGIAAAASGKAGGFLAGGWGDGSSTQALHRRSFALHEQLARELGLTSYRKIPTLSVARGRGPGGGLSMVSWLDGDVQRCVMMDSNTAQVTPGELCHKLHAAAVDEGAKSIVGEVINVVFTDDSETKVKGIVCRMDGETHTVEADNVVIAMGPWSTRAGEWFGIDIPMTGIKSTSIVYEGSKAVEAEPAALFCEEDAYGCHLEVYPRPDASVYVCGAGGSDYVNEARLLPGGDCDRADAIQADISRVRAAMSSFGELSRSVGGGGKEPVVTQACMRPCAPDALPMIGPITGVEGAYMACAHNCWGILWSPVTGEIITNLITEGKSSIDISPFLPTRFMRTRRGRGRRMRERDVGEQW
jgi:glycine/D-amino acid oxidase-like deaminating enzyme